MKALKRLLALRRSVLIGISGMSISSRWKQESWEITFGRLAIKELRGVFS